MRESGSELQIRPSYPRSEYASASSLGIKASSIISSCRICLSSIFDPAALTCGHRFCEKCLTQYWRVREKPDYIVCPLCRTCAYNVDFVQREKRGSTEDFRKTFTEMSNMDDVDLNYNAMVLCLKMSVLMPTLYCLVKWLKIPLIDFFTSIRNHLPN